MAIGDSSGHALYFRWKQVILGSAVQHSASFDHIKKICVWYGTPHHDLVVQVTE